MFYIRDCNDKIIGNLKGYRTMRGAQAQTNNHRSPVYRAIWSAFDAQQNQKTYGHIFSIRMEGTE
jgi:hypothetical protein